MPPQHRGWVVGWLYVRHCVRHLMRAAETKHVAMLIKA